jgi:hypothetical protein
MAITSSELFGPQDAQEKIAEEQDPDDQSQDVGHRQSLSQALAYDTHRPKNRIVRRIKSTSIIRPPFLSGTGLPFSE